MSRRAGSIGRVRSGDAKARTRSAGRRLDEMHMRAVVKAAEEGRKGPWKRQAFESELDKNVKKKEEEKKKEERQTQRREHEEKAWSNTANPWAAAGKGERSSSKKGKGAEHRWDHGKGDQEKERKGFSAKGKGKQGKPAAEYFVWDQNRLDYVRRRFDPKGVTHQDACAFARACPYEEEVEHQRRFNPDDDLLQFMTMDRTNRRYNHHFTMKLERASELVRAFANHLDSAHFYT